MGRPGLGFEVEAEVSATYPVAEVLLASATFELAGATDTATCVAETCNGLDDDCDGDVDEGCSCSCSCTDADGDLYGVGADCLGADCDDGDPTVWDGASELEDYVDNDCDGVVDDGARIRLQRLFYAVNGFACTNPGENYDHCYSTGGDDAPCAGVGQGGGYGYVVDAGPVEMWVYPGDGSDEITVGPWSLAALHSCYDAVALEHALWPAGDPNLDAARLDPAWACTTEPIGYVRTGAAIPDPDQVEVYFHESTALLDRMYSALSPEGSACGYVDHGAHFWAWSR